MPRALPACVLGACLALVLAAERAVAQGGYTTETHRQHGLKFPRARSYDAIPTSPAESWIVLKYAERLEVTQKAGRKSAPEMQIVRIDWVPDPAPETSGGDDGSPGGGDDDAGGDGDEGQEPADGPPAKEKAARELPLNSFERFLERRLRGWSAGEGVTGRERRGWRSTEYALAPPPKSTADRVGWATVWEKERERTFVVLGFCAEEDLKEQSRIWRGTAGKMSFTEPLEGEASPERQRWERYYERRRYVDSEYRIDVRLALIGEWKAEDTENYIVIYDTKDEPLVRKVVRDLELIRGEYEKLFPPAGPIEAVSTVRVCADRDQYFKFGGPRGTAGFWNDKTEELVLYDGTKREKGKQTDKLDTFIVLYHEAFHQYIHYSAGELAPHSWYNEGNGDYFSGARIKSGRVRDIGPNRWRVGTIKKAVSESRHVPWAEIIRYEQAQYYSNPAVCYAQGWSMIYFLNTSKLVERHPSWSRILSTYFEVLKQEWAARRDALEQAGQAADLPSLAEAQKSAREAAVAAAFESVDLNEIEEAWRKFVLELEDVER